MSPEPTTAHALAYAEIVAALSLTGRRPLVVGLCGSQGSGKTTLAASLSAALNSTGTMSDVLSLDDLYLGRAARCALAAQVHPLFATRGVPGTHDIALGQAVIAQLEQGDDAALPRFDKAHDDRCERYDWPIAPARTEVLILEGWCVGARPQSCIALATPINELEALEDREGIWRRHVNATLAKSYAAFFDRIDVLILLAAPGFEVVAGWRGEQEDVLRARAGADAPGVLSPSAIKRFISHYERLTRHILADMPQYATMTIDLDAVRNLVGHRTAHFKNKDSSKLRGF